MLFVNTLKAPYITHLLGNATKIFSDMVMFGEMIKNTVRSEKIDDIENAKRFGPRRKDNEVDNAGLYKPNYSTLVMMVEAKAPTANYQGTLRQEPSSRPNTKRVQLTPISMSNFDIFGLG